MQATTNSQKQTNPPNLTSPPNIQRIANCRHIALVSATATVTSASPTPPPPRTPPSNLPNYPIAAGGANNNNCETNDSSNNNNNKQTKTQLLSHLIDASSHLSAQASSTPSSQEYQITNSSPKIETTTSPLNTSLVSGEQMEAIDELTTAGVGVTIASTTNTTITNDCHQQHQQQILASSSLDGARIDCGASISPENCNNNVIDELQQSQKLPATVYSRNRSRWYSNEEVASILANSPINSSWLSDELQVRPRSGAVLLYSREKVRYRQDGYCWKKRKNGRTTREDHMKLKVHGIECIYGCYVHSAILPTFHRRCYWLLENPDIVLVHYLNQPLEDQKDVTISFDARLLEAETRRGWTNEQIIEEIGSVFGGITQIVSQHQAQLLPALNQPHPKAQQDQQQLHQHQQQELLQHHQRTVGAPLHCSTVASLIPSATATTTNTQQQSQLDSDQNCNVEDATLSCANQRATLDEDGAGGQSIRIRISTSPTLSTFPQADASISELVAFNSGGCSKEEQSMTVDQSSLDGFKECLQSEQSAFKAEVVTDAMFATTTTTSPLNASCDSQQQHQDHTKTQANAQTQAQILTKSSSDTRIHHQLVCASPDVAASSLFYSQGSSQKQQHLLQHQNQPKICGEQPPLVAGSPVREIYEKIVDDIETYSLPLEPQQFGQIQASQNVQQTAHQLQQQQQQHHQMALETSMDLFDACDLFSDQDFSGHNQLIEHHQQQQLQHHQTHSNHSTQHNQQQQQQQSIRGNGDVDLLMADFMSPTGACRTPEGRASDELDDVAGQDDIRDLIMGLSSTSNDCDFSEEPAVPAASRCDLIDHKQQQQLSCDFLFNSAQQNDGQQQQQQQLGASCTSLEAQISTIGASSRRAHLASLATSVDCATTALSSGVSSFDATSTSSSVLCGIGGVGGGGGGDFVSCSSASVSPRSSSCSISANHHQSYQLSGCNLQLQADLSAPFKASLHHHQSAAASCRQQPQNRGFGHHSQHNQHYFGANIELSAAAAAAGRATNAQLAAISRRQRSEQQDDVTQFSSAIGSTLAKAQSLDGSDLAIVNRRSGCFARPAAAACELHALTTSASSSSSAWRQSDCRHLMLDAGGGGGGGNGSKLVGGQQQQQQNCLNQQQQQSRTRCSLSPSIPLNNSSTPSFTSPSTPSNAKMRIVDYAPNWCDVNGGAKVLIVGNWIQIVAGGGGVATINQQTDCCASSNVDVNSHQSQLQFAVLFDSLLVSATLIQSNILRCYAPSHDAGFISMQVLFKGTVVSQQVPFEMRAACNLRRALSATSGSPNNDVQQLTDAPLGASATGGSKSAVAPSNTFGELQSMQQQRKSSTQDNNNNMSTSQTTLASGSDAKVALTKLAENIITAMDRKRLSDSQESRAAAAAAIATASCGACGSLQAQDAGKTPTSADFWEYFKAASCAHQTTRSEDLCFASLTLNDSEQLELYEAAKTIQKAYRTYRGRKRQACELTAATTSGGNRVPAKDNGVCMATSRQTVVVKTEPSVDVMKIVDHHHDQINNSNNSDESQLDQQLPQLDREMQAATIIQAYYRRYRQFVQFKQQQLQLETTATTIIKQQFNNNSKHQQYQQYQPQHCNGSLVIETTHVDKAASSHVDRKRFKTAILFSASSPINQKQQQQQQAQLRQAVE